MKEVKIQIPDNCELVKDGDNYVVREKKQNPPRSWEEFCEKYPIRREEVFLGTYDNIIYAGGLTGTKREGNKNWITSKEEAEAFLALMQLRQLRKAWVGDWEQPKDYTTQYAGIFVQERGLAIDYGIWVYSHVLSFPTQEMAEDFLGCFRDLCETAKILL